MADGSGPISTDEEVRALVEAGEEVTSADVPPAEDAPGAAAPDGAAACGDEIDWERIKAQAKEPETDIGNARRFLVRHGDDVAHIDGLGWAAFDKTRWAVDYSGAKIRPLAHETVESIRLEARVLKPLPDQEAALAAANEARPALIALHARPKKDLSEDEAAERDRLSAIVDAGEVARKELTDRRSKRLRYCKTSGSSGKIDNMMREAAPYRSREVAEFDADALALNARNGTLWFFKDGKAPWQVRLDPHARGDFITKICPVDYDEAAEAPLFEKFVETILPDEAVRAYVQRYLGLCLTGITTEQVFAFFWGRGRNGKSTLVDIVCRVMGDYTTTVPFETLAGDDRRKGSEATPDLVKVPGARLVRTSEPEKGMKFRESMIKSLTGGEPILIRRMREEFIEVYPSFKLVVSGNHRPDIRGTDDGIWRRVHLVPFTVQIPKAEIDRLLPQKLWAERSGILNWLIAGVLSYLESGLDEPEAVRAATESYREETDHLGGFVAARLDVTLDPADTLRPDQLVTEYKDYCQRAGVTPWLDTTFQRNFPEQANRHGFTKAKSNGFVIYRGVRVRPLGADDLPSHTHGGAAFDEEEPF